MRGPRPPPAGPALARRQPRRRCRALGFLAAAAGLDWYIWRQLGDVAMGAHGWIALVLGTGAALVLGGGLM